MGCKSQIFDLRSIGLATAHEFVESERHLFAFRWSLWIFPLTYTKLIQNVMTPSQKLNPRNWSILCWVLIAIWLIPVFTGHLSLKRSIEADGMVITLPDGTFVVEYPGKRFGFPLHFMEFSDFSNGDRTRKYDLGRVALNFTLVGLTLAGIVVVVHNSSWQVSIRALMLSTAVLGLLIVLAQAVDSFTPFVIKVTYFIPLIIGGMIVILNLQFRTSRKKA